MSSNREYKRKIAEHYARLEHLAVQEKGLKNANITHPKSVDRKLSLLGKIKSLAEKTLKDLNDTKQKLKELQKQQD